ncbi:transposase family protein [Streptomyces sp. NPDC088251]|uniref:transposase family protein n=1 Tax=Streptomyces sp. NPDC088251 TaxID=3365844 RepID=UPI00381B3A81
MGSLQLCSVEIASLLPQLVNVLVVSADVSDAVVTVHARTRSGVPAGCTGCGQLSAWCHSRYVRHLADVTLGGRPLRIELSVRRLYCENPTCPKVTFAEQVPGLTVRHQRRTPQLQRLVEAVGVVLAGRGGARMLRILNVTLSRLGLDRRTVRKYARARTWQEVMRRPPRKPSTLDPYLDYPQQRWDEGQHSAKILHGELRTKGCLGHYQRVKMAVAPLRRGLPLDEPRERPPSPREAARWITTHPGRRSPHINDRLDRLLDHCPELRHTHDLVRRFASMLDNHDATPLPRWLDDLANSGLASLAGLAGALREDRHAVAQGIPPLTTPGSTKVASPMSSCKNA